VIRIKVGTRGSLLSRKQTEIVLRKIKDIEPDIDFEIVIIRTKGDKIID
jgi:hydroxymethylbilane synthase